MVINIISGIHKKIFLYEVVFLIVIIIPFALVFLINKPSLEIIVWILVGFFVISLLMLLFDYGIYLSEPHFLEIDFDLNIIKLFYRKKIEVLCNVVDIKVEDNKWYIVILSLANFSNAPNIEVLYKENEIIEKTYIGHLSKQNLNILKEYLNNK